MSDDRSRRETLAGEYALGLLTGDELRDVVKRLDSDPEFASEVARWQGRLAPLHAETEDINPPADVWRQIEAQLPRHEAANDNQIALRRRLLVWKSIAGGMTAVAASLALVLAIQPRQEPPSLVHESTQAGPEPMVAMLGSKGSMKVVASWDPGGRRLVLAVPGEMATDAHHSNELWVIPAGGKPRSLGTMPDSKQMHMQLADALATLLQQGATIAVSVEPRGGSPTGAPTGPVIASGALTRA